MSPSVALIIVPSVKAFAFYARGELGGMRLIAGMTTPGKKKKESKNKRYR